MWTTCAACAAQRAPFELEPPIPTLGAEKSITDKPAL